MENNLNIKPDIKISVNQTFGIDSDMDIDAFSKKNDYVPEIDKNYIFDRDTTLAILSGFAFNKRVLIQGYHGTGKSTHIEQIAARLNWPCVRINLDSHVSRIDLIGKDAITLKNGKQVTEFKEGILPWAIQNSIALVFDATADAALLACVKLPKSTAPPAVAIVIKSILSVRLADPS